MIFRLPPDPDPLNFARRLRCQICLVIDALIAKSAQDHGKAELALREIFNERWWFRKTLVFLAALCLLVLIGPFGTYSGLSLPHRIVFWSVILSGVGLFMHIGMVAAMTAPPLSKWPQIAQIALGSAAASTPGAAFVVFVHDVYHGPGAGDVFWLITVQVFFIGIAIGCAEYMDWGGKQPAPDSAPHNVPDAPQARLLQRVSPEIRGEIVSLSMQDHYVEVTTTRGREMILLRFGDALAEVENLSGLRIHRSHWAAKASMTGLSQANGRTFLDLADGRKLPVSATYHSAVEDVLNQRDRA